MAKELIYHVRYSDLISEDTKHYYTPKAMGHYQRQGITFAFEERADGWYGAYSVTNPKQQFCRRIGVMAAVGRLHSMRVPQEGERGMWKRAQYFGHEKPTYDDCVVLFELLRFEYILELVDKATQKFVLKQQKKNKNTGKVIPFPKEDKNKNNNVQPFTQAS